MHALWLVMVLTAAPIHLAAPKTQISNLDAKTAEALSGQFAQQMSLQRGFLVTTPDEMSTLLGLERQKSLLGCAESCTAELAGALGVDGVVLSTLSKVGNSYLLNAKVVGARNGEQLAVVSSRLQTVDQVIDAIAAASAQLADAVRAKLRPGEPALPVVPLTSPAPAPVSASSSSARLWLVPVIAGAAVLIAGGACFGVSKYEEARIRSGDPADVDATISAGRAEQTSGLVLMGIGGAAVIGGVLWAVLGGSSTVQPAVSLGPGFRGISVRGEWP